MNERLIIKINYEREWKKTLLYRLGKKKPSESWKRQLERIYKKKYDNLFLNS